MLQQKAVAFINKYIFGNFQNFLAPMCRLGTNGLSA